VNIASPSSARVNAVNTDSAQAIGLGELRVLHPTDVLQEDRLWSKFLRSGRQASKSFMIRVGVGTNRLL